MGEVAPAGAVEFVQRRLSGLSRSLGDKLYLDGDRFTAGDLMMTTVLRILGYTDIVTGDPRLAAYIERCTARPAFKRALDAQLGDFRTLPERSDPGTPPSPPQHAGRDIPHDGGLTMTTRPNPYATQFNLVKPLVDFGNDAKRGSTRRWSN